MMLAPITMEYRIREYGLQQGALEIEYIEEYFGEFPEQKDGYRGGSGGWTSAIIRS